MFEMHRIFCATPWELEWERTRFYELVGAFNERAGLAQGVLYVPVSLVNIRDKRPMQYAIDENIEDSRHYLLLTTEDWGPAERNFRNDYQLALEFAADPSRPMRSVAVLAKKLPPGGERAESLPEPQAAFGTRAEFDECVERLLAAWLEDLLERKRQAAGEQ